MANGKKKTTAGKRNKNNANAAAARGRKGLPNDGLYYYRKGEEGRAARKKAIADGTIEQTPNRKKVRELQALKNKKASKAAKAQLTASSYKASAHGAGSKARRAKLMKKADKLQKKADRKYKRVTGKSPVQKHCTPVKMNAPITVRAKRR